MKKIVSITLALVLVLALGMTAFAVTASNKSKADLKAYIAASGLPTQHQGAATQFVDAMTEEQAKAVDVKAMKAVVDGLIVKAGNGTITAGDIAGAEGSINEALNGFKITLSNVSIDTATGIAKADIAGGGVSLTAQNAVNMPYSKDTASAGTAAAAPTSVIKATGLDLTSAAILFALAVMGVLGCAVVKTRKASARA